MNDPSPAPDEKNPYPLLLNWMTEATASEPEDADAACLATSTLDGVPNARMVLVRTIDERGFAFFTNYHSVKGQELTANPKAALCFHWKSLRRQLRSQGRIEPVLPEEADHYFSRRPRASRIGAWASLQSQPMDARTDLTDRFDRFETEFRDIADPPRPPHWSGFRMVPDKIEFWQQTEYRLHDRVVYDKGPAGWRTQLLYP